MQEINDIPVPLLQLAGFWFTCCCMFIIEDEVDEGVWCAVVTEKNGKKTYRHFTGDTLRESHNAATGWLAAGEADNDFDWAVLAFDACMKIGEDRTDALTFQMFDLDSVADRRIFHCYRPFTETMPFALVGGPMLFIDGEMVLGTAGQNWSDEFQAGILHSPFGKRVLRMRNVC